MSGPKYLGVDSVPDGHLGVCTTCGVVYDTYNADECPVCSLNTGKEQEGSQ